MIKQKFILNYIAIVFLCSLTGSAYAEGPSIKVIQGTLKSISTSVANAISMTELLYVNNAGLNLKEPYIVSKTHPQFKHFQVGTGYTIEMQFKSAPKIKDPSDPDLEKEIPVTPGIYDVKILMVPIFTPGDGVINSWACFTDADYYLPRAVPGQVDASNGDRSLVADNTDNLYLMLCMYASIDTPLF
ncbi:MAG: hypothetical protein P8P83_05700 [Rickettsiaceae bacterium]|nr:hypothetical protein [Rickettsiaceae bacterium]